MLLMWLLIMYLARWSILVFAHMFFVIDDFPECETVTLFKEYFYKMVEIRDNEELSKKLFQADREKLRKPPLSDAGYKLCQLRTRIRPEREQQEQRGKSRELKKYGFTKRQLGIIKEMSEFIKKNHHQLNKMFKQTGLGEVSRIK